MSHPLPRELGPGVPAGFEAPRPVATAPDTPALPEGAEVAAAARRLAVVLDALEPLRVDLRDRLASYREFRARFASSLITVALLAGLVALVAWLR